MVFIKNTWSPWYSSLRLPSDIQAFPTGNTCLASITCGEGSRLHYPGNQLDISHPAWKPLVNNSSYFLVLPLYSILKELPNFNPFFIPLLKLQLQKLYPSTIIITAKFFSYDNYIVVTRLRLFLFSILLLPQHVLLLLLLLP